MEPIVTLTMNPAVDLCTGIDRLVPAHKLRCGPARHDAGGGGINVARVVRRFGGDPLAIFPAGGPMGQLLEQLVQNEDVRCQSIPIAGDTREDITIDEASTGLQYRFVLPGPALSNIEIEKCLAAISAALTRSGYLVASGSLPPGAAAGFYGDLAALAVKHGAKFVLDSSGPGLGAAIGKGVHLIKPSLREFEDLTGKTLPSTSACVAEAKRLIAKTGVNFVALTLGEKGALLVSADFAFLASAPNIKPVSTVGAGDSFLGALVWSLAEDNDIRLALRLAVAAGTAALLGRGTELCRSQDVDQLLDDIEVDEI